jgi:hypothetical protein
LILSDARMASLSASVGSSLLGTFAESMTHISHRLTSHRLTFTALRSARLSGEPWKIWILLFIAQNKRVLFIQRTSYNTTCNIVN